MTRTKNPLSIDQFAVMTVDDAIRQGLVREVSDLPLTNGDLSRMVEDLVKNTTLNYADIVTKVRAKFPHAKTTTKSVASVACVMRKKGTPVPLRLKLITID